MNVQVIKSGKRRNRNRTEVVLAANSNANNGSRNNKTARNRRRRQRRNINLNANIGSLNGGQNVTPLNYFHKYFALDNDVTLESSVHKMIQTSFFPTMGVTRGKSNGMDSTALTYLKGAVDIIIGANGVGGLVFVPTSPTNFIQYNNNSFNPTTTGAAGYTNVAIPLTATQATSYRYLSASIQVIPSGQPATQSGAVIAGYCSDYNSLAGSPFTVTALEQQQLSMGFSSSDTIMLHALPNASEQYLIPTTQNLTSPSCLFWAVSGAGNGTNTSFRFEYTVTYEFVPSSTIRPFVNIEMSDLHPDATYWLNLVANKSWNPLMVAHYADYANELTMAENSNRCNPLVQSGWSGASGTGTMVVNGGNPNYNLAQRLVGTTRRVGRRARQIGQALPNVYRAGRNMYSTYNQIRSLFGNGMQPAIDRIDNDPFMMID